MTNKEAATILNSIKAFFSDEHGNPISDGFTAIEKAANLLLQTPDEHGDLIDRDVLKEQFIDNGQDIDTLDVIDIVNDALTVIAAERSEHGTTAD